MSEGRIHTTRVGSLPRPQRVVDLLFAQDSGVGHDPQAFEIAMRQELDAVLARQVAAQVDVVSHGEYDTISNATYSLHAPKVYNNGM